MRRLTPRARARVRVPKPLGAASCALLSPAGGVAGSRTLNAGAVGRHRPLGKSTGLEKRAGGGKADPRWTVAPGAPDYKTDSLLQKGLEIPPINTLSQWFDQYGAYARSLRPCRVLSRWFHTHRNRPRRRARTLSGKQLSSRSRRFCFRTCALQVGH